MTATIPWFLKSGQLFTNILDRRLFSSAYINVSLCVLKRQHMHYTPCHLVHITAAVRLSIKTSVTFYTVKCKSWNGSNSYSIMVNKALGIYRIVIMFAKRKQIKPTSIAYSSVSVLSNKETMYFVQVIKSRVLGECELFLLFFTS